MIRLSSMGDVILTTPLLRCLKRQMPDCELHFLTKPAYSSLLGDNPYVDRLLTLDSEIGDTVKRLKSEHYDFVADLHNNHRSRIIRRELRAAGARCAVYNKENIHKFIYISTKLNVMSGRHVVDRYFGALKSLGIGNDGGGLELYASAGAAFRLALPDRPFVAIACGAQHATKRIPDHILPDLCSMIEHPVVLLGDGGDAERIRPFEAQFHDRVVNLCGKCSLKESVDVVGRAAVVVSPDTGLMHAAAAFHKPLVAVWGATAPPLGFTPYRVEYTSFEVQGLLCHPCSRQGGGRCPMGHFKCMRLQDWHALAADVNLKMEGLNKR